MQIALFIVPFSLIVSSFATAGKHLALGNRLSTEIPVLVDTPRENRSSSVPHDYISSRFSSLEAYDSMNLQEAGLSRKAYQLALKGMEKLRRSGKVTTNILTIVDMSQPSDHKRLYVIDLDNYELVFNTWVAHGRNTGTLEAKYFSNSLRSHKTSLGFYVTGETYRGSNGYSLKLMGVETGFNSNAYRRAIVVHGADYVSENYIASQGFIGRSYGCPAVPSDISSELIDEIKEGSCLFIYSPSPTYIKRSALLR